jgi:hypothetical protein
VTKFVFPENSTEKEDGAGSMNQRHPYSFSVVVSVRRDKVLQAVRQQEVNHSTNDPKAKTDDGDSAHNAKSEGADHFQNFQSDQHTQAPIGTTNAQFSTFAIKLTKSQRQTATCTLNVINCRPNGTLYALESASARPDKKLNPSS